MDDDLKRRLIEVLRCPHCKGKFSIDLKCESCGYTLKEYNGILIFPSKLVEKFTNYALQTELPQYVAEAPTPPSSYYPRYIPENAKIVLDCGGGDGNVTALFAQQNPNSMVFIVDADIYSIRKVRKRKIENMIPLNSSVTCLPFGDNSVDVVISVFMVEHMYDRELSDFYFETYRVLKSGGKLVIASDSPFFDKYLAPFIRLFKQKNGRPRVFLNGIIHTLRQ